MIQPVEYGALTLDRVAVAAVGGLHPEAPHEVNANVVLTGFMAEFSEQMVGVISERMQSDGSGQSPLSP